MIRQNDEFSEEEMEMREIAVIKEEWTFGEYALIENKPRSATIQCVEDWIFAVLNKQEYTKVLLKIEKKIMNEKALFLKSVPYFSKWTNMAVNKFTYYFHDKSFIRNQEVFKEGQKVEYVYIVKQGEFELTKSNFSLLFFSNGTREKRRQNGQRYFQLSSWI